jgi:Fur family ferric uptake transcriptional regulator
MQPASKPASGPRQSPTGRSTKRDRVVSIFLGQEGHVTADELVELVRREDQQISRASVYRALQWMVDAGIARKIDLGEGRFRFEHSYRQPRHFHLICRTCNRSFEFFSSDIEALIEDIAAARSFTLRQSVLQIHGTCESCRTGRPALAEAEAARIVFTRDALRIAMATERSGLEFYTRAARLMTRARGRRLFEKLAGTARDHLASLERRYRELLREAPQVESRATVLFFTGAANGLFAAGAAELPPHPTARQTLTVAIRCVRGAHRFFRRHSARFEDEADKRIFLEIAAAERGHLDLLIRAVRALGDRRRGRPA